MTAGGKPGGSGMPEERSSTVGHATREPSQCEAAPVARFQGSWSGPVRAVSTGSMRYEWDAERAATNQRDHGVSFEAARGFRWETALEAADQGGGRGVRRVIALGRVVARLHVMVYTRRGETVRVISLRRATPQEEERYERG